jgi:hypothetical protein
VTTCADVDGVAAEAALGFLAGEERARLLAHVESCDDCRRLVAEMSVAADELVLLAPDVDPPAGFESRVLARMTSPPRPRRRWPALAAAAAVVVIGAAVALTVIRSPHSAVAEATMRTPQGDVVGDAYVHRGEPSWVFVAVPRWTEPDADYELRVTLSDGTMLHVAGPREQSARGGWGTTVDTAGASLRLLELVGSDGRVWCSASV